MSVIVKGMEMPKNCWECSLSDIDDDFGRCCLYSGIACLTIGRQDNCPLIEIPTPHGRLIDADDFMRHLISNVADLRTLSNGTVGKALHDTPTIVEAEGSEE